MKNQLATNFDTMTLSRRTFNFSRRHGSDWSLLFWAMNFFPISATIVNELREEDVLRENIKQFTKITGVLTAKIEAFLMHERKPLREKIVCENRIKNNPKNNISKLLKISREGKDQHLRSLIFIFHHFLRFSRLKAHSSFKFN